MTVGAADDKASSLSREARKAAQIFFLFLLFPFLFKEFLERIKIARDRPSVVLSIERFLTLIRLARNSRRSANRQSYFVSRIFDKNASNHLGAPRGRKPVLVARFGLGARNT